MNFRIADTFTTSLSKLTGDEQKAVKTTAFDLQLDPANPGMKFHKLDRAKDKNFWSVRVSRDIRLIVHKTSASMLLCYVDHHDAAYHWAERRKLETHPKTGAAQLVEIRETVQEVAIPVYVEAVPETAPKPLLFDRLTDDTLLSYGVPPEWLAATKEANEETLFDLTEHLPAEASEALLTLATGGTPAVATPAADVDPFNHPDAQRRFRVMASADELAQALDYPWEKWAVFLHPSQRDMVQRDYNGPARVAGTAGTGKTVVALHRAARLARDNPTARVLVATFNEILSASLKQKLRLLLGNRPGVLERVDVDSMQKLGMRLYTSRFGKPRLAHEQDLRNRLKRFSDEVEHPFSDSFVWSEWRGVADAWQLASWDEYRKFKRLGRKIRLNESQRACLWSLFEQLQSDLDKTGQITSAAMFTRLAEKIAEEAGGPYDFAVVDEAQDLSVPELRFLGSLTGTRPNGLFFAGDQGQRIFQAPFSWKTLGVDIQGRSKTLRINYRTSHQIRSHADRLLPGEISDVDGNSEDRRGTISAFDGPTPRIEVFDDAESEIRGAANWLSEQIALGLRPEEIGIFVRSAAEFHRAERVVTSAKAKFHVVDLPTSKPRDTVSIMTMHLAKGLEYRSVLIIACDDEVIPLQERIETVVDDNDLHEVYDTERHLLYVACTRARDFLWVSGVDPASEFLDDM